MVQHTHDLEMDQEYAPEGCVRPVDVARGTPCWLIASGALADLSLERLADLSLEERLAGLSAEQGRQLLELLEREASGRSNGE